MSVSFKSPKVLARLQKRHRADRRFRWYGLTGILLALAALALLMGSMLGSGLSSIYQTRVRLPITFDPAIIDPAGDASIASLRQGNYQALVKRAVRELFPDIRARADRRNLAKLVSIGASYELQEMVMTDPALLGQTLEVWLPASDDVDMWIKETVAHDLPEVQRRISDKEAVWIAGLEEMGRLEARFNTTFFTGGDSREPELAGIYGAFKGSLLTLFVTFIISFPLGVATAVYLEEFAAKGRWADFIEVNINNLAAVPSIVFGLLGLALFLNVMHLPRSAPLVGGLTLAMMTLPTIVIATRAALRGIPDAIRDGARAMGASPLQVVLHHLLPLAIPGMLTGAIIGMARSLGESAPLLMIGMVAFIRDIPNGVMEASTVLPVQIYLWADSPERAFLEKTAGATLVLLFFLIAMNAIAVILRNRFERRW